MEILIVTGPLGAGKTTAVNRLLKAEVAALGHPSMMQHRADS